MIDALRLQNFKAHRDSRIPLGRLTMLVGPNGAGKTSVLQALDLLHRALREPWGQVFAGDASWEHLRRKATAPVSAPLDAAIEVTRAFEQQDPYRPTCVRIESRIVFDREDLHQDHGRESNLVTWEDMRGLVAGDEPEHGKIEVSRDAPPEPRLRELADALGSAVLLRPDPRKLAMPWYSGDVVPRLSPEGEGLADVIAHMLLSTPDAIEALQETYRAIVPQVRRFRVQRTKVQKRVARILYVEGKPMAADELQEGVGYELVFDTAGGNGIPASAMSEGSLIALGILIMLLGPVHPGLVLIDGLDHALHPRAQWEILAQIRLILAQHPGLQVVATTHSPDLVDKLEPSEVVVMALHEDGTVGGKPLTECPRTDMLDILCAGELWSALGEDWVVAPNAEASGGTAP